MLHSLLTDVSCVCVISFHVWSSVDFKPAMATSSIDLVFV